MMRRAVIVALLAVPGVGHAFTPNPADVYFPPNITALTNAFEINVGGMPSSAESPANILQGLSVKVAVPNTGNPTYWPYTGVSAYITNDNAANVQNSAVALFGWAGQTHDTLGANWGLNVVASNCASFNCPPGSGHANGNILGGEFDLNIRKIGSTTPIGQAIGVVVTGGGDVVPQNGAYAYEVQQFSQQLDIPWTVGFQTNPGAAVEALHIGTATSSGLSNSQPVTWSANNGSAGIFEQAALLSNGDLQWTGVPSDTGNIVAQYFQAESAFKIGASGSGVTVMTSVPGGNTTLYDETGTADILLSNASGGNFYRQGVHIFQNRAGSATFLVVNSFGVLLQGFTMSVIGAACNSGNKGYVGLATDLNAPTYDGIAAGGGTSVRLITCDGTNWRT